MEGTRVFKVEQELTLFGLRLWQLALIGGAFAVGIQVQPARAPWLSLGFALLFTSLMIPLVLGLGRRLRGEALPRYLSWLFQAKHYLPGADPHSRPLLVYLEGGRDDPSAGAKLEKAANP